MRRQAGLTLVEVLVSTVVVGILSLAFSAIVMNYFHVFGRNYAAIKANAELPAAQETMYRHLSHLSRTAVPDDGLLSFRIPVCDTEGRPSMPFDRSGVLLAFYRSDSTGATNRTGDYLWLGRGNRAATTFTPHGRPIARYVTGLTFEYLNAAGSVISRDTRMATGFDDKTISLIRVTVTVRDPGTTAAGGAARPATTTVSFTVAPRNNHD